MPQDETLGASMCQTPMSEDNPVQIFDSIIKGSPLDERERFILAARRGVFGNVLTLREIGEKLKITRERVRQLEEAAKEKLGSLTAAALREAFPDRISDVTVNRAEKKNRAAIRAFLQTITEDYVIQYVKVHEDLGLTMYNPPENADTLDEIESCWSIFASYGIRNFGKYRICTGACQM